MTQSSALIDNFLPTVKSFHYLKRIKILILVIIWVMSLSILTKALTGNLLNIYFNVKSVPIVNTLEDIYKNKELLLKSNYDTLNALYLNKLLDRGRAEELFKRTIHIQHTGQIRTELLFKLIEGKIVMMENSLSINYYLDQWNNWIHLLSLSSYKYIPSNIGYSVNIKHPLAAIITFM